MAFKQSWAHVKRAAEPTTFQGKYGLKRTAGMEKEGNECFVIPLDMAAGYSCLPYHSLKKNDNEGFHGSTFNSVKITCKKYDPETGEVSKELPLCCKLAQLEKDRLPETEDSAKRALSFTSFRYVFPVLVLSTTETDPSKKPTIKKISIKNGVSFSFVDLAASSYDEDIKAKVIDALIESGKVEDATNMDQEELMEMVAEYISNSIIKITNEKSKTPSIPYQKSYRIIPNTNELIGQASNENKLIRTLCKLLAGKVAPDKLDELYQKAPILQEINNQVIDFLELFNDNVDSLTESWEEDELQKYYDDFVARAAQIEKYKAVNERSEESEDEEEEEVVEFESSLDDAEDDDSLNSVDLDEEDIEVDVVEEVKEEPVKAKKASKKVAVAAGDLSSDDFSTDDLETSSSVETAEFEEEDFAMGEDDFEDLI